MTMKSQTDEVSLVRRRLPYTDRRSLSQAWYDALHLAPTRRCVVRSERATEVVRAAHQLGAGASVSPDARIARLPSSTVAAVAVHRRSGPPLPSPDESVRRAERRDEPDVRRRTLGEATPLKRFDLRIGDAEMQLFVRAHAGNVQVIAVCRHADRVAVERALARAVAEARAGGQQITATLHVERRAEALV